MTLRNLRFHIRLDAFQRFLSLAAMATIAASLAACSSLPRDPVPLSIFEPLTVDGFDNIRIHPFTDVKPGVRDLREAFATEGAEGYSRQANGTRLYEYLAVSGGGSDGAFGAGLLNGWTAKGDRPNFKIVTGVSTGALIAPFAFLGSARDEEIKQAYTTVDAERIFIIHNLITILSGESLADTGPFRSMVSHYITPEILDAIAAEHRKGRRLYVATTDMDREEPVIWNLGAIAASDHPQRLDLFRNVLIASAAVPAVFPPVLFKVREHGQVYDELHADGGLFFQAFFVTLLIDLPGLTKSVLPKDESAVHRLFVIRDGTLAPQRIQVRRSVASIATRGISTLFKVSGLNDIYRLYLGAERTGVEFNYISMPEDYKRSTNQEFDMVEMNRQFQLGFGMGVGGIPWRQLPPNVVPVQEKED